jgi:hypothetical protein
MNIDKSSLEKKPFEHLRDIQSEADYYQHMLYEKLTEHIPRLEVYNSVLSDAFRFRKKWIRGYPKLDPSGMEIEYTYTWGDPVGKFRLPYWFINMTDEEFEESIENLERLEEEKREKQRLKELDDKEKFDKQQYEKLKARFEK